MARIILILSSAFVVFLWHSLPTSAYNICQSNKKAYSYYKTTTFKKDCPSTCQFLKSIGYSVIKGYMNYPNDQSCYCTSTLSTFPKSGWRTCRFGGNSGSAGTPGTSGSTGNSGSGGNTATGGSTGNSGSGGSTGASSGGGSFKDNILKKHNEYRQARWGSNAYDLVYDDNLAQKAQAWADYIASQGSIQHDSNKGFVGENIWWSSAEVSRGDAGTQAVEDWYGEICIYNACNYYGGTGHFTQVLWKGSKKLGCGYAYNQGKGTFVVCRYDPPGNFNNLTEDNVGCPSAFYSLKAKVDCPTWCSKFGQSC